MQPSPYRQYQTNKVLTASTGDLVLLLYNGAIRYLGLAERALEERRLDEANTNLFQAQEVVLELYAGLNYELGDELAQNLGRLYRYMHRTLIEANVQKDADKVRHIKALLLRLRTSWRTVIDGQSNAESPAERLVAVGMPS